MTTSADLVAKLKKEMGANIAKMGNEQYVDTPRLPTGIFPLDLASGGGFPMGRVSLVYGPESSNKTNVCLKAIAQGQIIYPDKKAVFVDAEGSYDPVWASIMGVDTSRLIVMQPEYAEQAVDIVEAFLYAEDVFVVVLDSIAALCTQNEVESSAEKVIVGGASNAVGKMFRKATISFNRMRNQGKMPPAFIGINQIRFKIGVMFGNPETMPGGNAPKYASSFTLRVYGKNEMDKKIHPVMPAWKHVTFAIQKWKMPVLATTGEFKMLMQEGIGQKPGWVNDWNTLYKYLQELDYISKSKQGYELFGETYPTLTAAHDYLYADPELLQNAKSQVIAELLDAGQGLGAQADTPEESAAMAEAL